MELSPVASGEKLDGFDQIKSHDSLKVIRHPFLDRLVSAESSTASCSTLSSGTFSSRSDQSLIRVKNLVPMMVKNWCFLQHWCNWVLFYQTAAFSGIIKNFLDSSHGPIISNRLRRHRAIVPTIGLEENCTKKEVERKRGIGTL